MTLSRDIFISKTLSWLLRHGAEKDNVPMSAEGYINVRDILSHRNFAGKCTLSDLRRVVATNNKQRFSIREDPITGTIEIKANQGHTIVLENPNLYEIKEARDYPEVIHGTYHHCWNQIKKHGLSRMKRTHIHFANTRNAVSGVRMNREIDIYVNIEQALRDGYKFYESENKVILCPGNERGFLPPAYFLKVVDLKTNKLLEY